MIYTHAQLQQLADDYAKGDLILHGNRRRKYRRDIAQNAFANLVATALAALDRVVTLEREAGE